MKIIIEGREAKESDIGSPVTYIPNHAGNLSHPDCERGHISSMRDGGIWVRFRSATGAKCDPSNLRWG